MNLDQRNSQLEERLKDSDLSKAVEVLVKDAKKRKRNEKILAISILLDVLLTLGLGLVSIQTHRIAVKADTNRNALIRTCESGNEARKNNREIWDYVLEITANAPPNAQREKFISKVNATFAPRDCSSIK